MIIGIDASRANLDHKTGVEWYSYYLIRWLAKVDSKNSYILYTDKPLVGGLLDLKNEQYFEEDDKNFNEIKYDEKNFQIVESPFGNFKAKVLKWPFRLFWTQGRLSLERLLKRPYVLFIPANILLLMHPKKSIATIHDLGFETATSFYDNEEIPFKSLKKVMSFFIKLLTLNRYCANKLEYVRWATRFTYRNATKIITVSEFSKNEIIKFYKKNIEKIKVIYNGYNKLLYQVIDDKKRIENVKNKYGIEGEYILYVGRIEKKKNITTLIEAFAVYCKRYEESDLKLVLVGIAGFGYDEIMYLIAEHDIIDQVIISGWIPEQNLPELFNGAKIFIFPSMYEGFGIPLLQAMACGVPVLASDIPPTVEIVNDAALLINPKSSLSIFEGIEVLVNNQELREKFIKKGFEVIKNFSWKKCAQETLKEINNL